MTRLISKVPLRLWPCSFDSSAVGDAEPHGPAIVSKNPSSIAPDRVLLSYVRFNSANGRLALSMLWLMRSGNLASAVAALADGIRGYVAISKALCK